jgi:hypothetical protein
MDGQADSEGRFVIEGLGPGEVRLQASTEDEDGNLVLFGELRARISNQSVTIPVDKWIAQCGLPGPGPRSLRGKLLPDLERLDDDMGSARLENKRVLVAFWRQDSQTCRHFMQKLIHMAPELEREGFVVMALRVPTDADTLVRQSLVDLQIPFPHGTLADADECIRTWGFSPGWLPWVIITGSNHIVTTESFGLPILRKLCQTKQGGDTATPQLKPTTTR